MWPKMLIELLPHLSRLVPMWDKFLSSKAANEKAAEDAMKALTDEVRKDLGQITAAHASLYRQLQDQSAQIALLHDEVVRAREAADRTETAVRMQDPYFAELAIWARRIVGSLVAVAFLIILSIVLQLTIHHAA